MRVFCFQFGLLFVPATSDPLQRDLDLLDDEELYCNLMGEGCGERMDVDERRWPSFVGSSPAMAATTPSLLLTSSEGVMTAETAAVTSATATVAPPQQEERRVAEEATSLISDDLDMDVCQQMPQQQQQAAPTWSWTTADTTSTSSTTRCGEATASSGFHLFESIQVCDPTYLLLFGFAYISDSSFSCASLFCRRASLFARQRFVRRRHTTRVWYSSALRLLHYA